MCYIVLIEEPYNSFAKRTRVLHFLQDCDELADSGAFHVIQKQGVATASSDIGVIVSEENLFDLRSDQIQSHIDLNHRQIGPQSAPRCAVRMVARLLLQTAIIDFQEHVGNFLIKLPSWLSQAQHHDWLYAAIFHQVKYGETLVQRILDLFAHRYFFIVNYAQGQEVLFRAGFLLLIMFFFL